MDFAHGVTARRHPHAKPARSTSHDHKQVNSDAFRFLSGQSCHLSLKMMTIKVQVGEGGSLLGEEVVGHMVNEHLAEQLGEVYRSAPPFKVGFQN